MPETKKIYLTLHGSLVRFTGILPTFETTGGHVGIFQVK